MSVSPFNQPVNINICKAPGTIFSVPSGGGGTGAVYSFFNIGTIGAGVLASVINNQVNFYRLLNGINSTAIQGASGIVIDTPDLAFDTTKPSTSPITGLGGVTLNGQTVLQALTALLYPIRNPGASISVVPSIFEYGDNTNLNASWAATQTDEPITSITVNGASQIVTGNTQNGSLAISKTGLVSVSVPINVATATKTSNAFANANVSRMIRYGTTTKDGIINTIVDSDIQALSSFFFSLGNSIPSLQLQVQINQYIIIEIPVAFGNNWIFKVNGFVNNAFNLVRNNQPFVNSFGYSDIVNVWISQSFATGNILLDLVQSF